MIHEQDAVDHAFEWGMRRERLRFLAILTVCCMVGGLFVNGLLG